MNKKEKTRVLVVDDDQRMRELVVETLAAFDIDCVTFGDPREALLALRDESFGSVVTDLRMPHVEGLELLAAAHASDPDLPVIVITGHGTIDAAIAAMKQGAFDFIQKPFDPEQLLLAVKRATGHFRLILQNRSFAAALEAIRLDTMVGSSTAMRVVASMIQRIAPLDVTVLIEGETGTGKELAARLIHQHSGRKEGRFLPVNCGALSESLLESELFGHEKGAFTGADRARKGLLEAADNGTLFLDEIHQMSPALQVRLLRFLQDGRLIRVGGTEEIATRVRVIAAANDELQQAVRERRFRDDLFYRLNVVSIGMPPLRERREDIPELAYHFLRKHTARYGRSIERISAAALRLLCGAGWPGNVRELGHAIERGVVMEQSAELSPGALPPGLADKAAPDVGELEIMTIEEMERMLVKKALRKTGGNRSEAARLLGIDPSTLWRKMKSRKAGLKDAASG